MNKQDGKPVNIYLFLIFQCVVLVFSCALLAKSVISLWVRLVRLYNAETVLHFGTQRNAMSSFQM